MLGVVVNNNHMSTDGDVTPRFRLLYYLFLAFGRPNGRKIAMDQENTLRTVSNRGGWVWLRL
jgi:hypothetical protein